MRVCMYYGFVGWPFRLSAQIWDSEVKGRDFPLCSLSQMCVCVQSDSVGGNGENVEERVFLGGGEMGRKHETRGPLGADGRFDRFPQRVLIARQYGERRRGDETCGNSAKICLNEWLPERAAAREQNKEPR